MCLGCKKDLPMVQFSSHSQKRDGRAPRCKDCGREQRKDMKERIPANVDVTFLYDLAAVKKGADLRLDYDIRIRRDENGQPLFCYPLIIEKERYDQSIMEMDIEATAQRVMQQANTTDYSRLHLWFLPVTESSHDKQPFIVFAVHVFVEGDANC